jgi:hypothetical protein
MKNEPQIHLYFYNPFCVSVAEFEEMERELFARAVVGEKTIIEQIAYRLYAEHRWRYHECRDIIAARGENGD